MAKKQQTAGETAAVKSYKKYGEFLTASDTGKDILAQFRTVLETEKDILVSKLAVCGAAMGQAWLHFSAIPAGSNKPVLSGMTAKDIADDLAKALGMKEGSLRSYLSTVNRGIDARSNTLNEKLREAALSGSVAAVKAELKTIGSSYEDIRSVLCPSKKSGKKKGANDKKGKRAAAVARFAKAGAALDMNSLRTAIDALAVEFGLTSALVAMWTAGKPKKAKKA